MRLLPVRHAGGAHVTGEHFRAGDFRDAVDAELGMPVTLSHLTG